MTRMIRIGVLGGLLLAGIAGVRASEAEVQKSPHAGFDALLKTYVDDDGMVDYRSWKANDTRALRRYMAVLGAMDPATLSRDGQLAYWINAYNALTIQGILEHYPLKSIKDKVSRFGGYNIWDDYPAYIRGKAYSLNHIEHKILRSMGEPRIHFAIVCASISCPRLRNEAYVAERLDEQLDDNARDFFGRSRNFQADVGRGKVRLSSILKWFGEDFGKTESAVLKALSPHVADPKVKALLAGGRADVSYLDYDWNLNEQREGAQ